MHIDLLAYCLMPNHFHLMIYTPVSFDKDEFVQSYKTFLSSYTWGINKQEGRIGSLFRQNSKAKEIADRSYALTCFRYILRNPIKDKLVKGLRDWPYSSCIDSIGLRKGTLMNSELAIELLELPRDPRQIDRFLNEEISNLTNLSHDFECGTNS